jgi:hypothetical protein
MAISGPTGQNDDDEATLLGINERFNRAKLWAIAVAIEHGVLLARIILAQSSPTVPIGVDGKVILAPPCISH